MEVHYFLDVDKMVSGYLLLRNTKAGNGGLGLLGSGSGSRMREGKRMSYVYALGFPCQKRNVFFVQVRSNIIRIETVAVQLSDVYDNRSTVSMMWLSRMVQDVRLLGGLEGVIVGGSSA